MVRLLVLSAMLVIGAILGPVIFAAIAASLPPTGDWARESPEDVRNREIGLMMGALDEREKQSNYITRYSMRPPPDGKECGYDPDSVFHGKYDQLLKSTAGKQYAVYRGYWALDRWRSGQIDEAIEAAIRDRVQISKFEAGFLRRCIQQTSFSGLCADQVDALRQKAYAGVDRKMAKREHSTMYGHEDNVVCAFVDGVAARKGLPLAKPFDQRYADDNGSPF
ncbi:MAG: hypothetical protein ACKOQM_13975 [Novosphingobium sp.]